MKRILRGVNRIARRASALERLEKQLTVGTKTVNEFDGSNPIPTKRQYPLTDKDIKRIKLEITILKSRI
jgi:hypothetical protein